MGIKDTLAKARQNWDDVIEESKSGGFENLPDGTYVAKLGTAELKETSKGKAAINWTFVVLEGDQEGKTSYHWIHLEGERGIAPLGWFLNALRGPKLEDIEVSEDGIQAALDQCVESEPVFKVQLTTNGDFQNPRITKFLDKYVEGSSDVTEEVDLQPGMKVSWKKGRKTSEGVIQDFTDDDRCAIIVDDEGTEHTVDISNLSLVDDGIDGEE